MNGLLAITPGDGRPLVDWVRAVVGVSGVLIREPTLPAAALEEAARAALDLVGAVALHARNPRALDLADRLGVPVHLSSTDPVRAGAGVSAHDRERVDLALAAGARYVLLSPVWAPTSKPDDRRPTLGLERFLEIAAGRPVLALGGVTPERWRSLREAGAGAAILGPLTGSADEIRSRVSRFLA